MQLPKLTPFPKCNQDHSLLSHFSRRVISLPVTQLRLTHVLADIPEWLSQISWKASPTCPFCLPWSHLPPPLVWSPKHVEEVDGRAAALTVSVGSKGLMLIQSLWADPFHCRGRQEGEVCAPTRDEMGQLVSGPSSAERGGRAGAFNSYGRIGPGIPLTKGNHRY